MSLPIVCFQIPSDQLYLTAIQNLFKSAPSALSQATVNGPAGGNTSNAVQAHKGKSFKFDRAKNMLYAIHNLGMAIATAKWVAKQLPVGTYYVTGKKQRLCPFFCVFGPGSKRDNPG